MGYGEDGTGDKGTALTGPGKGWGRTGNRSDQLTGSPQAEALQSFCHRWFLIVVRR